MAAENQNYEQARLAINGRGNATRKAWGGEKWLVPSGTGNASVKKKDGKPPVPYSPTSEDRKATDWITGYGQPPSMAENKAMEAAPPEGETPPVEGETTPPVEGEVPPDETTPPVEEETTGGTQSKN